MGEFKKRIEKLFEIPDEPEYISQPQKTVAIMHIPRVKEKLLQIVEEAKKEWPNYSHVEDKYLSQREFSNLLVKQNRERWDWFFKWFGEE